MTKWIYKIKVKIRIGHYLVLLWPLVSKVLLLILKLILLILPISLIEMYVIKLDVELVFDMVVDYRIFLPEVLQIGLIIYILYRIIKATKEFDKRIYFFYYLGFFIVGSITMINIFTRTRFIFAYFLPFILGRSNDIEKNEKKIEKAKLLELFLLVDTLYINIFYAYFMLCNGVFR